VSRTNIHRAEFWFLHYYLLCTIFVSRMGIPCTFHSTRCTMPKFSMPPPCTNTLCTPLTKLSRDNIYPYCACTDETPIRFANTTHTMDAIIMCVHTTHTLSCVCTPCTSITHASLYSHCAMLNLARTPTYQHLSMWSQNLVHAPTHQHFSARCQI
jgi:hypothetical protein